MNKINSKMIRNIFYAALTFLAVFGVVAVKAEKTSAI